MSAFFALLRHEISVFYQTSLALVYVLVFLLLSNSLAFYLGDLYEIGQASMQSYFRLLPWVCLLLMPALSMRAWSDELRTGTYEILLSLPVSMKTLIAAKFIALCVIAFISLLLSISLWITLSWLGQPDHGVIFISYLGSFLMMATMLAIGLCMSSISENQLIVYLLTAMAILVYLLAGYPLALDPMRELLPQTMVDLISSMSFLTRMQSISRGVIALSDVFYFTISILVWLSITACILHAKKSSS